MNLSEKLSRRSLMAGAGVLTLVAPANATAKAVSQVGVVILIDNNDPYVMGHAIGYSANLSKHFAEKNADVSIEVVANGKGIDLFRADKTKLAQPLAALKQMFPTITYSVCDSSKKIAEQKEQISIALIPDVELVPFGIGRVVDLQMGGWAYIHA